MKILNRMKNLPVLLIAIFLLTTMIANASENSDMRDEAYGNDSSVFSGFISSARSIDNSTISEPDSLDIGTNYSDLIEKYNLEKTRDPLAEITKIYPEIDTELLDEVSSWNETTVIQRLQEPLDESVILAILVTRSPRIENARNNWLASLERYPQTVFLQDILAGYLPFTEGLSLGAGQEYQRDMIQMHYATPGMLDLRGRTVELDIDIAWQNLLQAYVDVIADAKVKLAEIHHKDDMIRINNASVSQLSLLSSVVNTQYTAGTKSFADLVRIRTELASRQDKLNQVKSMRDSVTGQLASMLDLPPSTVFAEFTWPDDLSLETGLDTLVADLIESNHELQKISFGVRKMDAMIEMTMLRADPDQTFGFTYFQGRDVSSFEGGMDTGSNDMQGMDMGLSGAMEDMDMGSMNFMNSPMFDHRGTNFTLDLTWANELVARREAMNEMLSAKTDMLSGMLNMQYEKYQRSINSAGVSRGRIIPNSQSALDIVRTGYVADENNFNDLVMAELGLLMARMDLANYELDARTSLAEIERTLGHSTMYGMSY